MMKLRTILILLLVAGFGMASYAQGESVTVNINDLKKVTTTISNASTSSSTGEYDFQVKQGTDTRDVFLKDLSWISVRHDLTPSNENYIKLELTFKNGSEDIYEMAKYTRFTGTGEEGSFAIMVKDINTIQIVPSGY